MINTVNQNLQYLLPLDLELSNEGLKKWLQKRTIHRNRAYVSNFLSRLGLNEKDTKGKITKCFPLWREGDRKAVNYRFAVCKND